MTDILAFIEARERDVAILETVSSKAAGTRRQELMAALGERSVPLARALVDWQDLVEARRDCRKCHSWNGRRSFPCEKHMGVAEYERRQEALAAWAQSAQASKVGG